MKMLSMNPKLFNLSALVFCTSVAASDFSNGDVSVTAVATGFTDALRHQRYRDAAAMFVPTEVGDIVTIEHTLMRIDDSLGGFSTIRPIAALPEGKSIKLDVAAHGRIVLVAHKFIQFRYISAASDGQPVFYELDLTADTKPPKILSFGLHFSAVDAQAEKRANKILATINH